ncbi:xanthine dehydrogenase accessory factor [Tropicibacter naphthalenivorans]|uniref:Xanthine dehydrogenase accessory protein XdhC n=2 Tax=Tropicibacter naphthalenivorans TaxID=441103 RepID=A0A0P1GE12_9RHOB|nr:xanthine dehydrogenase accessory protein XdhC [Tropicibacter naphthalenivorans]SMC72375.1 xanthine dehydrogenase accessory factor [Tropicibacter naphthalenivorans]
MDQMLAQESTRRQARGEAFVMATVVRTMAATSAKPGAKALVDAEGTIVVGFLGGGCVRGAVGRAARDAIRQGQPQLLSIRPEELLQAEGVAAGDERDGVKFARNGCPSKGALDIFIEPVLPKDRLIICGAGPVAQALAALAERFDFERIVCVKDTPPESLPVVDHVEIGFDDGPHWQGAPFVVVATQGAGDALALARALDSGARHIAFVGSRRKFANLSEKLMAQGIAPEALARVQAPAGVDIHAITPDEIALSILADLIRLRREGAR